MARADEKTRTAFWIENELLQRCDICWQNNGFASRNAFVNRAIEEYIITLTLENSGDVFTEHLGAAIAKAADDGVVKISKGLFRYAVVQEILMHILANLSGITKEQIRDLRRLAIRDVRRTRGKVNLEAIADFQNEDTGPVEP